MPLSPLAVHNYGSLRRFDLWIRVGPWLLRVTSPYYGGTFGNGSRWWSGWSRWTENGDV